MKTTSVPARKPLPPAQQGLWHIGMRILACLAFFTLIRAPIQAQSTLPAPELWRQSIERPMRAWDFDGTRILGHLGQDICLWDAETGRLIHRMKGHRERIHAVQFSPDGRHALSSSWMGPGPMVPYESKDTRTILWNLDAGADIRDFPGQVIGEFSPDGSRFVTFTARKVDIESNYETTDPDTGEVENIHSTYPVTRFDNAAIWETLTGRHVANAKLEDYCSPRSETLHFSPDGRRFVLLVNGDFLPYNSSGGMVFKTDDGQEIGRIRRDDVKFGNGHRYTSHGALATLEPAQVRLIDFASGEVNQSMAHDLDSVWGSVWTHDGSKAVAIPNRKEAIQILNVSQATITLGAKTHPSQPGRAIMSPDNRRLAIHSGGNPEDDPQVRLYALDSGEEVARISVPVGGEMIGFSPDAKTLLIGGPEFVVYRAENGEKVRSLGLLDGVDARDW